MRCSLASCQIVAPTGEVPGFKQASLRAGPSGVAYMGGGTESRRLESSSTSQEHWESMRGGLNSRLIGVGSGIFF